MNNDSILPDLLGIIEQDIIYNAGKELYFLERIRTECSTIKSIPLALNRERFNFVAATNRSGKQLQIPLCSILTQQTVYDEVEKP